MAPEILRDSGYDTKADIFSLGAVLYTMVTSQNLFFEGRPRSPKELLMANRDCKLTHVIEKLSGQPKDLRTLIVMMLAINPQERPSAAAILDIIRSLKAGVPLLHYQDSRTMSIDENLENYLVKLPALM